MTEKSTKYAIFKPYSEPVDQVIFSMFDEEM